MRDITPHEWADHYAQRAAQAQRDADNHAAAAAIEPDAVRAAYLRREATAHANIAAKYREIEKRSARLAERLDDQARTYGRAQRHADSKQTTPGVQRL